MSGVNEDAAEFGHAGSDPAVLALAGTPFAGLNRYRTFGEQAPMYEVLSVHSHHVRIHIFDNDEKLDYRLDRALNDPVAV